MSEPGSEPAPEPEGPGRSRGSRRIRRFIAVLVLAVVVLIVLVALSGISALLVRRGLTDGRAAMNRGRTQLLDGNTREAVAAFDDAEVSFEEATSSADAPWVRALSVVPYLGRTPDTMRAIAQASLATSQAGAELAAAVAKLPDGLASLAPARGRIPVERIEQLAEPLARADVLATEAYERVADSPSTLIVGPLGEARSDAEEQLGEIQSSLHAAAQIVAGLPAFLGADRPTRVLFGAENPAEQRGTGGIIGAYSILTLRDGRFRFSAFRPIQSLPLPANPADAPAPGEQYRRNYDFFREGNGYWLNTNMTPDFPLAGQALLLSYEALVGGRLDGVITADPFALEALLAVTGPEEIPDLGIEVDARNVVAFTTNEAYAEFPDAETRKLVLGAVAQRVLERFLAESDPSIAGLRAIAETAGQGHVRVYSDDPEMQAGLDDTGVGGAIPPDGGDFLSIVQNSASGNKLDYYASRDVRYDVRLLEDGTARASVDVALRNDSPTRGLPKYVIGPFPGISETGENVSLVSTYCAAGCELQQATLDGRPSEARQGEELGRRYLQEFARIPSGGTARIHDELFLPNAWTGNSSGGTYRLTFLNQTTIEPTRLHVTITPPDGMDFRSWGDELRLEGPTLVYDGTPGRTVRIESGFSPPLATRWIRNVTRPLSKPVIRF